MADIRFLCDKCGQKLRVDEEASGLKIACPGCGNMLVVPSPEDSVSPPPPPVEPTAPQVPANPQPTSDVPPVALAPAVVTATPPPQPVVALQPGATPQPVVVATQPTPQPVVVPRVKAVAVSPEPVVVTAAPAAPVSVQPAPIAISAPQVVAAPQPSVASPKVKKPLNAAQQEAERRQQEALMSQRPAGSLAQQQQRNPKQLGIEPIGSHLSRAELDTAAKLSKNNGIIFWGVALAGVVVMFIVHMIFTQREMITGALHVVLILVELTWTSIWGAMGMKHFNRAHVLEGELKERKKKRRI